MFLFFGKRGKIITFSHTKELFYNIYSLGLRYAYKFGFEQFIELFEGSFSGFPICINKLPIPQKEYWGSTLPSMGKLILK